MSETPSAQRHEPEPTPVALDAPTPPVEDRPSRRRHVLLTLILVGLLVAVFAVGLLGYFFLLPEYHYTFEQSDPQLAVTYPAYLSVGDEASILVTAINRSGVSITSTVVVLTYDGQLALSSALDQSNVLTFDTLLDGEIKSRTVTLRLQEGSGNWLDQARGQSPLKFGLRMASGTGTLSPVGSFTIQIAQFPYLRKLFGVAFAGSWGTLGAFFLWFLKQAWDELVRPSAAVRPATTEKSAQITL